MPEHVIQMINRFPSLCQNQPCFIYQRGLANLSAGNFRQGWSDYEARFDAGCSYLPEIQIPRWDGERCKSHEKILTVCEQGFGDILQFLRFMPWIRKVFPVVGILAPLPLCRLLDALKIFDEVIPAAHDSVISYSCFIPILSIPHLFSLHDEEDYRLLRKSIFWEPLPEQKRRSVCSRLRVALNWQGNIEAESPMATHRERSFQLSNLESVDSLRHVDLVCVQHGSAALQIQDSSLKDNLLGHGLYQGDFYDLASILRQCDILITNDTSVAHVGGLLGRLWKTKAIRGTMAL